MHSNATHTARESHYKCFTRQKRPGGDASQHRQRGKLVLIRGLPGSGKSTLAQLLAVSGFVHVEADQFFVKAGKYQFDASRIKEAHAWCRMKVREALDARKQVVVANTFTTLQEMSPYLVMTAHTLVVEAAGRWESIHGVPTGTLERMAARWEQLPPNWKLESQHGLCLD